MTSENQNPPILRDENKSIIREYQLAALFREFVPANTFVWKDESKGKFGLTVGGRGVYVNDYAQGVQVRLTDWKPDSLDVWSYVKVIPLDSGEIKFWDLEKYL